MNLMIRHLVRAAPPATVEGGARADSGSERTDSDNATLDFVKASHHVLELTSISHLLKARPERSQVTANLSEVNTRRKLYSRFPWVLAVSPHEEGCERISGGGPVWTDTPERAAVFGDQTAVGDRQLPPLRSR
jgi:hypothetical protein